MARLYFVAFVHNGMNLIAKEMVRLRDQVPENSFCPGAGEIIEKPSRLE